LIVHSKLDYSIYYYLPNLS